MLPEPVPPSGDNWPAPYGQPISPYAIYQPYAGSNQVPPPHYDSSTLYAPPPSVKGARRRAWPMRFVLATVVVVLVFAAGLVAMKLVYANNGPATTSGGDLGNHPITGTNPNCVLPDVDHTAAQNLTGAQLTSGLLDITHKKYEPIDNTTNFKVGQTVYFAFTVNSNAAATITADWCWGSAGDTSHYQLSVGRNMGIPGYFNLRNLSTTAVGTGVLAVRWKTSEPARLALCSHALRHPQRKSAMRNTFIALALCSVASLCLPLSSRWLFISVANGIKKRTTKFPQPANAA